MACALIRAWRAYGTGEEWHLPTLVGASGDTAKLVHWGLIAAISGLRDDGSPRNGWWRVTETGQDWVLGRIAVPRYVFLYDSRFLDFDGDGEQRWTVTDALGKKFDYEQLMTDPGTTDEAVF